MRGSIAKFLLFDTGFWIALLDDRDPYHSQAASLYEKTENWHGLLPWPILYEVLSTRLSRDNRKLIRLASELRSPGIKLINDVSYRDLALEKVFDRENALRRLSLVDVILRGMLTDINLRIDGFVTFNNRDFGDVCRRRRVPMYPQDSET